MSYEGVKYQFIRTNDRSPVHPWLKELQKWCTVFHEQKLAPFYEGGSHGNLSFRIKAGSDSFIITAAKCSLKESTTDDKFYEISKVDIENKVLYGAGSIERKPSSEAMLHDAIYKRRPEVMAILHGHCEAITKNASKIGIVTTQEFVESGTTRIIDSVMEVLGQHDFIEIKDHGFLSMGSTIEEAGELAIRMMKKAKLNQPGL